MATLRSSASRTSQPFGVAVGRASYPAIPMETCPNEGMGVTAKRTLRQAANRVADIDTPEGCQSSDPGHSFPQSTAEAQGNPGAAWEKPSPSLRGWVGHHSLAPRQRLAATDAIDPKPLDAKRLGTTPQQADDYRQSGLRGGGPTAHRPPAQIPRRTDYRQAPNVLRCSGRLDIGKVAILYITETGQTRLFIRR
jgi:hypothetical protein